MKKIILAMALIMSLVGCATTSNEIKPSVVVEYKYVTSPIPDESLAMPDKVDPIDIKTATQRDVADWLARSEQRTKDLENKLKVIRDNQEQQKKMDGKPK
jgi:uncharacterized lipoprotein NlpE involved in copper resistance